jgi:hypothetical protein
MEKIDPQDFVLEDKSRGQLADRFRTTCIKPELTSSDTTFHPESIRAISVDLRPSNEEKSLVQNLKICTIDFSSMDNQKLMIQVNLSSAHHFLSNDT